MTSFSVPEGSLGFWRERLTRLHVPFEEPRERFDEEVLTLLEETSKIQRKVEEWLPLFFTLLTIPLTLTDATVVEELGEKAVEGAIDAGKDIGLEKAADGITELYHKLLDK